MWQMIASPDLQKHHQHHHQRRSVPNATDPGAAADGGFLHLTGARRREPPSPVKTGRPERVQIPRIRLPADQAVNFYPTPSEPNEGV